MNSAYVPRLKSRYQEVAVPSLTEQFAYTNPMLVPKLTKIVINASTKDAVSNAKVVDGIVNDLSIIAGQRAIQSRARKAIANFKLREGVALGAHVTLRGARMWEFFDRLVTVAIPRIRDFRGLSTRAFDGRGNYALGLQEQIVFPEIEYDKITRVNGMNIVFVTTAHTDEEARALLQCLGMPFVR